MKKDWNIPKLKKLAQKVYDDEKEEYIKIDPQDIKTIINLLEGSCDRKRIINYIKEYIYNPTMSEYTSNEDLQFYEDMADGISYTPGTANCGHNCHFIFFY